MLLLPYALGFLCLVLVLSYCSKLILLMNDCKGLGKCSDVVSLVLLLPYALVFLFGTGFIMLFFVSIIVLESFSGKREYRLLSERLPFFNCFSACLLSVF